MLLGGDFRQIPPVAKYLERDAISGLTIAALPFWRQGDFQLFRLQENMRAREDAPFARFCMAVGDGALPSTGPCDPLDPLSPAAVDLPPEVTAPCDWTTADLLSWVYEGFDSLLPAQWPQFYENRSVLAPTNEATDDLNANMLSTHSW